MSTNDFHYLTTRHMRSIIMLQTLRILNRIGDYPRPSMLVRTSDPRDVIPQPTLASRGRMIGEMIHAKLIEVHDTDDAGCIHLAITELGCAELDRIAKEVGL